jgi:hypothetical protein
MRSGRLKFRQNARRAAPGGSQAVGMPRSSPYKDGAYTHCDANSLFVIRELELETGSCSTAALPSGSADTCFPRSALH